MKEERQRKENVDYVENFEEMVKGRRGRGGGMQSPKCVFLSPPGRSGPV
jgi:hypothetical protein